MHKKQVCVFLKDIDLWLPLLFIYTYGFLSYSFFFILLLYGHLQIFVVKFCLDNTEALLY